MTMTSLTRDFADRDRLIDFVKELAPWAEGAASSIIGGHKQAEQRLNKIDPIAYEKTRNYGDGRVTYLSPYLHHGILSLNDVRNYALIHCEDDKKIGKFIQELAWRDFWQRTADQNPNWLWNDLEEYKTGYSADNYQDDLPDDISLGRTGVACIDTFIADLLRDGYIHNHARMYIASYIVHFRRIKWQAGARWFLMHLLDGDEASNNLSWQWIASTFSNKPYIFNLENVTKYFGNIVDKAAQNNMVLDASYAELTQRLFPNIGEQYG